MAASFNVLKCHGCASTRFDFDKKRKVWICAYCGNEIQKTASPTDEPLQHAVKQVLTDLAKEQIDSAMRNVLECEKISVDNVCTIIADLSVMVYRILTNSCTEGERSALFGQMQRLVGQLKDASGGNISAEEEDLYNSAQMEGCDDAFGVLFLVFDLLNQQVHRQMVENYLDVGKIYAKKLNSRLLDYALKNKRTDMLEKIFANSRNIDSTEGLWKLLEFYEDGEKKRAFMPSLFDQAQVSREDSEKIGIYLKKAPDGADTKVLTYTLAAQKGIAPSIELTMDALTANCSLSQAQVESIIEAFSKTRPKDVELYALLDQVMGTHSGINALAEMKVLMNSGIFLRPEDRLIYQMIGRKDWSIDERIEMLALVEQCNMDARTNDGILAEILMHVEEPHEDRIRLIQEICKYVSTVSTPVMKSYVLNCSLDGEQKPAVLEELLQLDLNMSFFRDLLGQYARSNVDSPETKKNVTRLLSGQGLAMDSSSVMDLALHTDPSNFEENVAAIRQAVRNGTRIGNRDLSVYLEQVDPSDYLSAIMGLLHTSTSEISDLALAKYVLFAYEDPNVKRENCLIFARGNGSALGTSTCRINIVGADVICNLFQAYVLLAEDSAGAMEILIQEMKNSGARLNPAMQVNNVNVKFKKFVTDNKNRLSPITISICENEGVFKMFF